MLHSPTKGPGAKLRSVRPPREDLGELAGRYAHRRTRADAVVDDSLTQRLTSNADYVGARFDQHFTRWLGVRAEGRLLYERTSRTQRWDAAPSLVLRIINGIEVQGGYRFGDYWRMGLPLEIIIVAVSVPALVTFWPL